MTHRQAVLSRSGPGHRPIDHTAVCNDRHRPTDGQEPFDRRAWQKYTIGFAAIIHENI